MSSSPVRFWRTSERALWSEALIALGLSAIAFAVRYAIDPWLGDRQPFTPAFAAVALSAWFGGWRSGLLCAVVCQLWANYFFTAPRMQWSTGHAEYVGTLSYYLIGGVIIYLSHRATKANAELRQVDDRRAHFLAVLAHELRNPLGAIRMGMDVLRHPRSTPQVVNDTLASMQRQLHHATSLVDELLDLARIDGGKMLLEQKVVPLSEVLEASAAAAMQYTDARQQRVELQLEDRQTLVDVDPVRMTQVVNNLLHNASKFSPARSSITVQARRTGEKVHISIRDEGPGVPAALSDSIFEPFVQGSAQGNGDGLGLGLSLARKLVELHGGQLHLRPGVGHGSEFVITLPLARND